MIIPSSSSSLRIKNSLTSPVFNPFSESKSALETSLKGFDEEYVKERKQWQRHNIPIENPVLNLLQIHRSVDAKRIIEVLMKIYPELYVEVDDAETWLGTAQEYLDKEFDF